MDIDKAKDARCLLDDLDSLKDFQEVTDKEDNHWWSLLTPDIKRWKDDGIKMPEILREEFAEAVKRAIERTNEKLENL